MEATATLSGEAQLPTAPELPGTSSGNSSSPSGSQINLTDHVDTNNIGWVQDPNDKQQQLRRRGTTGGGSSTAYSFTGSALASANVGDSNAQPDAAASGADSADKDKEQQHDDSVYECNICLDTAKDAVVSMCGHLFCWPCLHQWLQTRPNRKLCPVCKAAVDKDKVIPLYGRNTTRQEDPRNKVPPRPAGQRTEPDPAPGFPGFGFGEGFHMSFGIGAFPFGFFTSSLNFGEPRPAPANRGTTQYDEEQTLSKMFLYLAFLCMGWLLFA